MSRWVSSRAEEIDNATRYNANHDAKGLFAPGGGGGGEDLYGQGSGSAASDLDGTHGSLSSGGKELKGTAGLSGAGRELKGENPKVGAELKGEAKGKFQEATGGLGFAQFAIGKAVLSPEDGQHLQVTHVVSQNASHVTVAGKLLQSGHSVTRTFAKHGAVPAT